MDKLQARKLIENTFGAPFDKTKFKYFIKDFLNNLDETKSFHVRGDVKEIFRSIIKTYERIGTYISPEGKKIDIIITYLQKGSSLDNARVTQRNFAGRYLADRGKKEAGLFAFVSPDEEDWRFSLVKMDYIFDKTKSGSLQVKEEFSPARRWSFLVGKNEKSHTAQSRLINILINDEKNPSLDEIEKAFDIEIVTDVFFKKYRDLFINTKEALDEVVYSNTIIRSDFEVKGINTVDFAKKLLGQIIFLYFLQKKGWFGVERGNIWGTGSKNFLRELFQKKHGDYKNFFNDVLEHLFYDALRSNRNNNDYYYSRFNCKIPFLNGGLFDPIGNYDWLHTDIELPNFLFSNDEISKEGDFGNGILDIFDRFNFTVKEDEPLEKEVAIDPELLGQIYEKLNAIRPDNFDSYKIALKSGRKEEELKFNKQFGVYYTPKEIVHYMCQQSLINYLATEIEDNILNLNINKRDIEILIKYGEFVLENYGTKESYKKIQLPKSIIDNALYLDNKLDKITVCDPAVGSGAFLVGMMIEIVKLRNVLIKFANKKNQFQIYEFKRRCIEYSLYGIDIDPGAVEITKLRLWLSLVVDEADIEDIKPLPNLDYKVLCGNSLFGLKKSLYNLELFKDLNKLKELFLTETDALEKLNLKFKIDLIIKQISDNDKNFSFFAYFSEIFSLESRSGFDVIIANPPYIGEDNNKEFFRQMAESTLKNFYMGKMDIFYLFFHLSIEIGKNHSQIVFITTDYYITANGAEKLRKDLKERTKIQKLIDFSSLTIFKSAKGQHNMITILTKDLTPKGNVETCITKLKGTASSELLKSIFECQNKNTDYYSVNQNDLFEGEKNYIRLMGTGKTDGSKPVLRILNKMKETCNNYLSFYCKINQGVVSGCDAVSKKIIENIKHESDIKLGDGIFIFDLKNPRDVDVINGFSDNEKKLLRPFYKSSDIEQYVCEAKYSKLIIYLDRNLNSLEMFPNLKNHLGKFRNILECRREVSEGRIPYFQLQWPRSEEIFISHKIVVPYRKEYNCFAYNELDWFCRSDCYIITKISYRPLELKYILSILNSKLYYHWLFYKGKKKGQILELFATPLNEIPIKEISINSQETFAKLIDEILLLKNRDDYLQNPSKQKQVESLKNEIDQMIYRIYGLTEEEIRLLEDE